MKSDKLMDILGDIDEDILEKAIETDSAEKLNLLKKDKKKAGFSILHYRWTKIVLAAACVIIAVFATVEIPRIINNNNSNIDVVVNGTDTYEGKTENTTENTSGSDITENKTLIAENTTEPHNSSIISENKNYVALSPYNNSIGETADINQSINYMNPNWTSTTGFAMPIKSIIENAVLGKVETIITFNCEYNIINKDILFNTGFCGTTGDALLKFFSDYGDGILFNIIDNRNNINSNASCLYKVSIGPTDDSLNSSSYHSTDAGKVIANDPNYKWVLVSNGSEYEGKRTYRLYLFEESYSAEKDTIDSILMRIYKDSDEEAIEYAKMLTEHINVYLKPVNSTDFTTLYNVDGTKVMSFPYRYINDIMVDALLKDNICITEPKTFEDLLSYPTFKWTKDDGSEFSYSINKHFPVKDSYDEVTADKTYLETYNFNGYTIAVQRKKQYSYDHYEYYLYSNNDTNKPVILIIQSIDNVTKEMSLDERFEMLKKDVLGVK